MLRVLSLGAGVQSTTLALMAAHGEIKPPDCAIFADTQWEPQSVYRHLDWLEPRLPFPVRRVSRGSIRENVRTQQNSWGKYASVPWHLVKPDGSISMGRRQCTNEYKLQMIMREIRHLLGKGPRDHIAANSAEVLIGISRDEAHRMKPARQRYMLNRWPLIELGLRRSDCLRWLERQGYPEPPKSACLGCPFHDNAYWRHLRDTSPYEWADTVIADRELRQDTTRRSKQFMHRDCVPLDEVDLSVDDRQLDLFGNECLGLCDV